jgi:hypothetical protein
LFIKNNIRANSVKIVVFKTADFSTHKIGNNKVEVTIAHKNEPIVEKKSNFHIFSQVLSHFSISESRGIV